MSGAALPADRHAIAVVVEPELGAVHEVDGRAAILAEVGGLSQDDSSVRKDERAGRVSPRESVFSHVIGDHQLRQIHGLIGQVQKLDPFFAGVGAVGIDEELVNDQLTGGGRVRRRVVAAASSPGRICSPTT